MKVLQINSVCGTGSTGRIAVDIHNILVSYGHESHIAFGRGLANNCNNTIKIGTKLDNYMHAIKTRIFDGHGFGSKRATLKFVEKVKELDPDIIHLHNMHGYYINIEVLFNYLKEANKPVIWTMHDCWNFTGHCAYFDYVGCDKWKTVCYDCPQKKNYPKSIFRDNSKKNHERKLNIFSEVKNLTIITPSNWLAELVQESFFEGHEVITIHNGIDLSLFKPTVSDFRKKYNIENKFIILGVSNDWDARKGFDQYIELAQYLSEDEVIVLVGITENQKKNLPKNVIGIKRTDSIKELAGIYSASNVFVNLTLEDNYPTVNLEAKACGTPVITYDTGGCAEGIEESRDILVKDKSISIVYEKIQELRNTRKYSLFPEMSKEEKNRLDKLEVFNELIELYRSRLE